MAATSQNYELWDTNHFLGVYRDVKPDPLYWQQWFENEILSEDEYIDFEKMPIRNRRLAPFVMPLARGKSVYSDTSTGYRFKPAYVKVEDQIDPLMPLYRRVGIDPNASQYLPKLQPSERLDLIRFNITQAHVDSVNRTWNYMSCVALRDGKITLKGENYPEVLVDFQRDSAHTITLASGSKFGDSGVSILDFFQSVVDQMTTVPFGGIPVRATMGNNVWNVMRKDTEILNHMDIRIRDPRATVERALVLGAGNAPVFKVGELQIGGGSGASIELWVDNSVYEDPNNGNVKTRYIGSNQILFKADPARINGFRAFGRIIDRAANWEPMPIFPKNWLEEGEVGTEYITHKSAPLFVPINPNATLLGNVL